MKNYRLKKEAFPFFLEKYATTIQSFDFWEKIGVDTKALEVVEDAYLTYGHEDKKNKTNSLAGWSPEKGGHYHFTVHFPSEKFKEHDEFGNGKILRKLMDKIQNDVNYFFQDFANKE